MNRPTLLVTAAIVFGIPLSEAAIISNPISVNFGSVPINTQVTQPIDVTVDTGYRLSLASGGLNAPFGFSFDTCGAGGGFVGPGNCSVAESFLPTGLGGISDTLNLFECPTAGGNCLSVGIPLFGTGTTVPEPSGLALFMLAGLVGWMIRLRAGHRA